MKKYVFEVNKNKKHRVNIEASTILEARNEIRKDYPNARFIRIEVGGRKRRK